MMKQKTLQRDGIVLMFLPVLLLFSLMAGCGSRTGGKTAGASDTPDIIRSTEQLENTPPETEAALPGTYEIPDGWVKWEKYSSKDKIFYVEAGHEEDSLPDNISIEVGTNRYGADEHEKFRDAIVRQLAMQIQGIDATLTGDGTYTEQDYILYIFTITEEDMVTQQYYIVGEQRYCLIHLTNFTSSEGAEEAARAMVDSFVWD